MAKRFSLSRALQAPVSPSVERVLAELFWKPRTPGTSARVLSLFPRKNVIGAAALGPSLPPSPARS